MAEQMDDVHEVFENDKTQSAASSRFGKTDILSEVPEVAQLVFMKLPKRDIHPVWKTSNKWKAIMSNERFWEVKYKKDYSHRFSLEDQQLKVYQDIFRRFMYWQSCYFSNLVLASNWEKQRFIEKKFVDTSSMVHYCDEQLQVLSYVENEKAVYLIDPRDGTKKKFDINSKGTGNVSCYRTCIKENLLFCFTKALSNVQHKLLVWNILTEKMMMCFNMNEQKLQVIVYENTFCLLQSHHLQFFDSQYLWSVGYEVECAYLYKNFVVFITRHDGILHIVCVDSNERGVEKLDCCERENLPPNVLVLVHGIFGDGQYFVINCERQLSTWKIEEKLILVAKNCYDSKFGFKDDLKIRNKRIVVYKEAESKIWLLELLTLKQLYIIELSSVNIFYRISINNYYIFTRGTDCETDSDSVEMWDIHTGKFVKKIDLEIPQHLTYKLRVSNTGLVYEIFKPYSDSDKSCFVYQNFDRPVNFDRCIL